MKARIKFKKVLSCSTEGIITCFETPEEQAKQQRRTDFMKSNCCTAVLYKFSLNLKREIETFKRGKLKRNLS